MPTHKEVAQKEQRDSQGHFTSKESNPSLPRQSPAKPGEGGPDPSRLSFLKNIFPTGASFSKATDENTLIDVHVGNPLKRIIDLLQDIKRQKAFSFNLKGSLGLAGVVLVITGMGVFGGTQAFCDKGSQSHFGTIKVLNIQEEVKESPLISRILSLLPGGSQDSWDGGTTRNRAVLFKQDTTIIRLIHPKNSSILNFTNQPVIATGNYNSCSQTLTLKETNDLELFR